MKKSIDFILITTLPALSAILLANVDIGLAKRYLISINLAGLIVFGYDKLVAKFNLWRIPEKIFFVLVSSI